MKLLVTVEARRARIATKIGLIHSGRLSWSRITSQLMAQEGLCRPNYAKAGGLTTADARFKLKRLYRSI
ncbi:protein of unknown function [Methylocella tundrae]|uniref:Uncharacterized protein n=1 Tax=Methylocella tundrae TaxID=227605 RepID=A0A4V6YUG8_METTU|nr:protein of unknown function [Methylocella tundrae]